MKTLIRDVMTSAPIVLPATTTVEEAARTMRDSDIGDVLVSTDGNLCGMVTDRDIVVRGIAEGLPPSTQLGEICTKELIAVAPDAEITDAARIMTEHAIRRLPVLDNGEPLGMVSLGDLARFRDPQSALAGISSAAPNN
jgi:CBS domain-containing protein